MIVPLLLYCVGVKEPDGVSVNGVCGARVRSIAHGGLQFYVSEVEREAMAAADVAKSAREVHAVVKDAFARGPVLPFRFATMLENETELENLAAERGREYADFLNWIGSRVQMDVRLSLREDAIDEKTKVPSTPDANAGPRPLGMTSPQGTAKGKGEEYLRQKAWRKSALRQAAEKCRQAAGSAEWRLEERDKILICHVLMERVEVVSFQEGMSSLELPAGVQGVVSGPWPPAGFWEDRSR